MKEAFEMLSDQAGRYFVWLVIGGAALAMRFPEIFTGIVPWISYLLGLIMLGMGMTLTLEDFRSVFRRPRDIMVGVSAQYLIMPALGFLIANGLRLSPDLAAGVVLVGTCPSGTASNVMTYLAKGDVALSVSITSLTTLVAPFLTPLLTLLLAGQWVPVPVADLFLDILKIVVLPVLTGLALRTFLTEQVERFIRIFPLISVLCIIAIIVSIVGLNAKRLPQVGLIVLAAVMIHNLAGFGLGYATGRVFGMEVPKIKAIMFEVGMQNSGLAAALAIKYFTAAAALPGVVFSVWHNLAASSLVAIWTRRGSRLDRSGRFS
jgi:bile acid:Na+ symporter, BASS family